MKRSTIPKFASLCAVAGVMVLGNSMLIPLIPAFRANLGVSQVQAGLIITLFSVGAGLTIPIAGLISDHVGRKNVIVPALLLYGLAGGAAGLVSSSINNPFPLILVARFFQGVGAGGTFQLAMALTGDIFQSEERTKALGYLESANGFGKVLAPLVGSALGLIAWFVPFFAYTAAAMPVAAAVWLTVKEPESNRTRSSAAEYARTVARIIEKKALPLGTAFFGGMVVLFLYFGVLSNISDLLSERYGVTGLSLGLVIAVPVSAMAVTSLLAGKLLTGKPFALLRTAVTAGLAVAGLSLFGSAMLGSVYLKVGLVSLMGVGNGVVLPSLNTIITSSAKTQQRGLITALYGTVRHVGAATGPPVFGLLANFGVLSHGLAASVALLASVLTLLFVKESMLGETAS